MRARLRALAVVGALALTVVTGSAATADPSEPVVPRPPVAVAPVVVTQGDVVSIVADRDQWVVLSRVTPVLPPRGPFELPPERYMCPDRFAPAIWRDALRGACTLTSVPETWGLLRWLWAARAELGSLPSGLYRVAVEKPDGFVRVPDMIPYAAAG